MQAKVTRSYPQDQSILSVRGGNIELYRRQGTSLQHTLLCIDRTGRANKNTSTGVPTFAVGSSFPENGVRCRARTTQTSPLTELQFCTFGLGSTIGLPVARQPTRSTPTILADFRKPTPRRRHGTSTIRTRYTQNLHHRTPQQTRTVMDTFPGRVCFHTSIHDLKPHDEKLKPWPSVPYAFLLDLDLGKRTKKTPRMPPAGALHNTCPTQSYSARVRHLHPLC